MSRHYTTMDKEVNSLVEESPKHAQLKFASS
jgi:hypothetical protein